MAACFGILGAWSNHWECGTDLAQPCWPRRGSGSPWSRRSPTDAPPVPKRTSLPSAAQRSAWRAIGTPSSGRRHRNPPQSQQSFRAPNRSSPADPLPRRRPLSAPALRGARPPDSSLHYLFVMSAPARAQNVPLLPGPAAGRSRAAGHCAFAHLLTQHRHTLVASAALYCTR